MSVPTMAPVFARYTDADLAAFRTGAAAAVRTTTGIHAELAAHWADRAQDEIDTRTESAACPACKGEGGRTEDTSADGVTRRTWIRCAACHGTGHR